MLREERKMGMLEKLGKAATKLEQAAALIREAISNASPSVPDRFDEM